MKWRRPLLLIALPASLAGCALGGAGLGSLVAQGLQGIGGSAGAPTNTGPFRTVDNSQTIQQLDDLASRTVSQTCAAEAGSSQLAEAPSATSDSQSTQPRESESPVSADDPDARCGYRNICLPGNVRPMRMLICRNDPASPTVAQAGMSKGDR
jgi:hypothetical protein